MGPAFRHGASPISAAAVDSAFLAQGMEARAHNLAQYDPSAAVDSHLERIRALALGLPPSPEREGILQEVEAAVASNVLEASAELAINGVADQLVADLRSSERNGIREVLGAKAIARRLREPLAQLLVDEPIGRRHFEAHAVVKETIAEVPRLMLLSKAVAHELGREKFALLVELTEKKGAAQLEAAGAHEDRSGGPGAQL